MKLFRWIFFALGLGFLGFIFYKIGLEAVADAINRIGCWFVVILPMNIVWYFADALGLLTVIRASQKGRSFSTAFFLRVQVSGEALNNLTPFMNLGGEPLKGLLISEVINGNDAISALIVDNTIKYTATVVFVAVGFVLSFVFGDFPSSFRRMLGIAIGVFALAVIFLILAQTRGFLSRSLSLLSRFPKKFDSLEYLCERAKTVDIEITRFYRQNLASYGRAFLLHFISRLIAVGDALLVLWVLGTSPSLSVAILVVSMSILINLCFSFIPLSMGVSEGGHFLLFSALGLSPETGVVFALIGRFRGLIWSGIGLGLLALRLSNGFEKDGKS